MLGSCISNESGWHRIFVYGTLKSGQPNHYLMEAAANGQSKLIGPGKICAKYPLVVASRFNIPFLLDRVGLGHRVKGEIWKVDDAMLSILDELEGHPEYYKRRLEMVECLNDVAGISADLHEKNGGFTLVDVPSNILQCWTYFLPEFNDSLLVESAIGYLNNYDADSLGPDRQYVAPKSRTNDTEYDYNFIEDVKGKR